ncbi:MAG: acetylxylan esterase [Sphingobacteriaceae bacterium]
MKDQLIDPLRMMNGHPVNGLKKWQARRLELLALYSLEMYGQSPGKPANMLFKVFDNDPKALNGKATRRQVTIYFNGKIDGPSMDMLIYLPNQIKAPVPLFIGLNFMGNHAVINDPQVKITKSWVSADRFGVIDQHATEKSRGSNMEEWPIEMILESGYGFATIYCGDIDPDFDDDFKNGVHAIYPDLQQNRDNFSTMAAWAWGLSRGIDYLQTDDAVNAKQVGVFGFSRLGKAALWAGATDTRFNMVISNESGKGGAALFSRQKGETIKHLNTSFPHWFCENFKKYTDHEVDLPFDQHLLLSLIAPRLLYVASAEGDQYSDPEGEFLSAQAASPIYRFLKTKGLNAMEFPEIGKPVMNGKMGYHIRSGSHGVTIYDWKQYLKFADLNWKNQSAY